MPDAPGLELIAQDLNDAHPGAVADTEYFRDQATLVVDPTHIIDVLRWLKETAGQEYAFCSSVHAVDYLPFAPRFGVHYQLLCMARVERLNVKALLEDTGDEDVLPVIDTCVDLFPSAEFQEREIYDFFGIEFRGHPDMRRILMPEGYVGWPQRRDFPVGGEPVLFTHNEHKVPRWYAHDDGGPTPAATDAHEGAAADG